MGANIVTWTHQHLLLDLFAVGRVVFSGRTDNGTGKTRPQRGTADIGRNQCARSSVVDTGFRIGVGVEAARPDGQLRNGGQWVDLRLDIGTCYGSVTTRGRPVGIDTGGMEVDLRHSRQVTDVTQTGVNPMFRRAISTFLVAALTVTAVTSCSDSTAPEGPAQFTVTLTDSPGAWFDSAVVEIGEVWVTQAGGPPIQLSDDGGTWNLLDLQNGVMAELATADIAAPARLLQLRLHVVSATVTLKAPYEFTDGETTAELFVPSGAQSGIKINLRDADGNEDGAGVDLVPGETILAVVDMDVERNFVVNGSPDDPDGIKGVLFTPLLRATLENVAGSISGTVTYVSATPDLEEERAHIAAVLDTATSEVLVEEMETLDAATIAREDGTYTVYFLSPGSYDVTATATIDSVEYSGGPTTVPVAAKENVMGVDFSL